MFQPTRHMSKCSCHTEEYSCHAWKSCKVARAEEKHGDNGKLWGTIKPLMFMCPLFCKFCEVNKTAKLKSINTDTMPTLLALLICLKCAAWIHRNKGVKRILPMMLPKFRAAKFKVFTICNVFFVTSHLTPSSKWYSVHSQCIVNLLTSIQQVRWSWV